MSLHSYSDFLCKHIGTCPLGADKQSASRNSAWHYFFDGKNYIFFKKFVVPRLTKFPNMLATGVRKIFLGPGNILITGKLLWERETLWGHPSTERAKNCSNSGEFKDGHTTVSCVAQFRDDLLAKLTPFNRISQTELIELRRTCGKPWAIYRVNLNN